MTDAESECWESAQRWHEKYLKAEAEIERLRAALQAMVDAWDMSGDEGQHRRIWDEARRALENKP